MKQKNRIIFLIFLTLLFIIINLPQARADFLPQIITIQNAKYDIIGYINPDGSVMDYDYNFIGYIRQEGRVEGENLFSIGYYDGKSFQDQSFNTVGFFDGNRIENSNFCPIAYIGFGTIEGQDYSIIGYFMGDTGGQDWVIAAFCLYFTDILYIDYNKNSIPEKERVRITNRD